MNFLDKYKPTTLSDLVGNATQFQLVNEFLQQFNTKNVVENPNLLIVGPNGIGKTSVVDICIEKNNFVKEVSDFTNVVMRKKGKPVPKTATKKAHLQQDIGTYYLM